MKQLTEENYGCKYYEYILDKKSFSKEEEIVHDFTDRRGLRQEGETIDDDIQEQIIEKWISIVKNKLTKLSIYNNKWYFNQG